MLGQPSDLLLTDPDDYSLDADSPGSEQVAEAATILVICVLIVVSNVLVIWAVATAPGPKEAIDFYVLSVAVADLLCGVFIVPLSVYPAIVQEWVCIQILTYFLNTKRLYTWIGWLESWDRPQNLYLFELPLILLFILKKHLLYLFLVFSKCQVTSLRKDVVYIRKNKMK